MRYQVYLNLSRIDDGYERTSIHQIVAGLKNKPDEIWEQGDQQLSKTGKKVGKPLPCDGMCWVYSKKYIESSFIENEFNEVLKRFSENEINFKEFKITLTVNMNTNGQINPEVILNEEAQQMLAKIGGGFWIDMYVLEKEKEDEEEEE